MIMANASGRGTTDKSVNGLFHSRYSLIGPISFRASRRLACSVSSVGWSSLRDVAPGRGKIKFSLEFLSPFAGLNNICLRWSAVNYKYGAASKLTIVYV